MTKWEYTTSDNADPAHAERLVRASGHASAWGSGERKVKWVWVVKHWGWFDAVFETRDAARKYAATLANKYNSKRGVYTVARTPVLRSGS